MLYAGSAQYYAVGRVGYPTALGDALAEQLRLDGTGRLLDVGCGPGNFTLLLGPRFAQVIGVDADGEMLAVAARQATAAGIANVNWLQVRAEELPAGLGRFQVISFAQSFHWLDQLAVARIVLGMLTDRGACVHVHAKTHEGMATDAVLPHRNRLVRRSMSSSSAISGHGHAARACFRRRRQTASTKSGGQPAFVNYTA